MNQVPAETYYNRPGAYAVISNYHGQIAVIKSGDGYFLPGGGIDVGETTVEAVKREILEEIGYEVTGLAKIGEAVEFIEARADGRVYRIESTFFSAEIGARVSEGIEIDHKLIWLARIEAEKLLRRRSQAEAVRCA